jgi:predicted DNA-binding transcriptional regulator AlpA
MKNGSSTATDELVPVTKAAEMLGLSRRAAYYLVSSGDLPAVQYPSRTPGKAGAIRVRLSEIEKFLKRSERAS